MSYLVKHMILPSIAPLAIIGLYFTPKSVFGCANRGLLAIGIVLVSACFAFLSIMRFVDERKHANGAAGWWLATAIILTIPLILLLGPLG